MSSTSRFIGMKPDTRIFIMNTIVVLFKKIS